MIHFFDYLANKNIFMPLSIIQEKIKMNASIAIDAYKKTKKETHSEEQLGHDVVRVALSRLQSSLHILLTSQDVKARRKAFEITIMTIYYLQKSLDLIKGGELAKNLFRLYEFCRLKVIKCGIANSNGSTDIKICWNYISEISDSWKSIKVSG